MINFDEILNSSQTTTIEDVQTHIDAQETTRSFDEGYWKPTTDKLGNALAEIRFLPTPPGEKSPFVLYYSHFFKNKDNGKVYSEMSRTTLGDKDPVGEENSRLWNTGFEADKDIARARSRKANYVANVLVLNDKNDPENNGKVFKYRFGKKIYEKIKKAMSPEFESDAKINPFDLLDTGANFRIVQKKVSNFPNYDDSHFGTQSALYNGDRDKMRRVLEGQSLASLAEIILPEKFKPYEDLKKRFMEVTGEVGEDVSQKAEDHINDDRPIEPKKNTPAETPVDAKADEDQSFGADESVSNEPAADGDDLDYFRKLASENS